MGLKIITPSSEPLIPLETCRQQCEVVAIDGDSDSESHPDDALILGMLDAAVAHAEAFTGMSLSEKTYELALDEFPGSEIKIPMPPIVSIVSVKYIDTDDTEQTIDTNSYVLDDYQQPAWLLPASDFEWPATAAVVNAVKIRFISGYGVTSDSLDLPANIRQAILLLLGHLYRHREDSTDKALSSIQNGFEALLRPMRIRLGMA